MARSAVTVTPRLLELIARLDDGAMPMAELNRRVGAAAEELGLMRPSYEFVRSLARTRRIPRRKIAPSTLDVLGDIAYGRKPVTILLDHSLGLDRWDIPLPPESK